MASDIKLQCINCHSILVTTLDELRACIECRFCGEPLRLTHHDGNCNFCRGEGFAVVESVVWICQLGEEE